MKEFPPFRLDLVNQCLWRGCGAGPEVPIALTPKAFGVLRYLIDHAGRLATHDELLNALWPGSDTQSDVLKSQIQEIRRALGDDSRKPSFIETLHRRGYRFIAPVQIRGADAAAEEIPRPKLVGRNRALGELRGHLRAALGGRHQIVCISGESGIGKTAVADEFERWVRTELPEVGVVRGQCVEGYGGKEAYYPMLEALGQLLEGEDADAAVQALAARAPTWLVQFPKLLTRKRREMLHREILGATRERMLREVIEALQSITARTPLLILFEDLQWVDHATVDLISALARQRGAARLMLVTTDRPVDLLLGDHPFRTLKRDLRARGLAAEMTLESLTDADVTEFLRAEAPACELPAGLAAAIHRNTEGNPLFMVAALGHMIQQGLLLKESGRWSLACAIEQIEFGVPEGLRQMIEVQIERLDEPQQRALEVASVCGTAFSTWVCAAIEEADAERFEELCEKVAQRHQIVRAASSELLPNGTHLLRYRFAHALYREVVYRRLPPGRRARLHWRIGQLYEDLGQGQLREIAPMLAHHFEQAGDWPRAMRYLRLASETAQRRFAHHEAASLLQQALDAVHQQPAGSRTYPSATPVGPHPPDGVFTSGSTR